MHEGNVYMLRVRGEKADRVKNLCTNFATNPAAHRGNRNGRTRALRSGLALTSVGTEPSLVDFQPETSRGTCAKGFGGEKCLYLL